MIYRILRSIARAIFRTASPPKPQPQPLPPVPIPADWHGIEAVAVYQYQALPDQPPRSRLAVAYRDVQPDSES